MITAGVKALASLSPALNDPDASLLPDLGSVRKVSLKVATAVANAAKSEGKETKEAAERREEEGGSGGKWTEDAVRKYQWDPVYRPLQFTEELGPKDKELHTGTW